MTSRMRFCQQARMRKSGRIRYEASPAHTSHSFYNRCVSHRSFHRQLFVQILDIRLSRSLFESLSGSISYEARFFRARVNFDT